MLGFNVDVDEELVPVADFPVTAFAEDDNVDIVENLCLFVSYAAAEDDDDDVKKSSSSSSCSIHLLLTRPFRLPVRMCLCCDDVMAVAVVGDVVVVAALLSDDNALLRITDDADDGVVDVDDDDSLFDVVVLVVVADPDIIAVVGVIFKLVRLKADVETNGVGGVSIVGDLIVVIVHIGSRFRYFDNNCVVVIA